MLAYEVVSYFYGESVKYYHILTIFTVRAKIYVNIEGKRILFMRIDMQMRSMTDPKQAAKIREALQKSTEQNSKKLKCFT